jgi:spore coat polysaccharide biosynthesis protein SpsF
MIMNRRLVAALACRNQGARLYGKPLQNLDVADGICVLDNIIQSLQATALIDEIVLGISEGVENRIFERYAAKYGIKYIIGDEVDVLSRLIKCGREGKATDIFRITTESPFRYFEMDESLWANHLASDNDATFLDNIIDGCGAEIIKLDALEKSHRLGEKKHRSELCTLYIREHTRDFKIQRMRPPPELSRNDLRLTIDNPEDLVVCRKVFQHFKKSAPKIPVREIVDFLDENPHLIQLIAPFTDQGYSTMYL